MLYCDVGNSVLCSIYKQMHVHFYLMLTGSPDGRYWKLFGKGKNLSCNGSVNWMLFAANWECKNPRDGGMQGHSDEKATCKIAQAHLRGCAEALLDTSQLAKRH